MSTEEHLSTPLMSASDPYYVVKDELAQKCLAIDSRVTTFEDVLYNSNTATNPSFKELKKALARELRAAESQLKDLSLTVDYVERDRATFTHIDDRELADRKAFLASTRQRLGNAREAATGARARRKIHGDEKAHAAASAGSFGARSDIEMANSDFIHGQQATTRQIMQEQDENIEALDGAVDRIHHMAEEIHGELKTQSRLIDDLEGDIDETADKMNFVMGKLSKLLKTKDSCQLWTIVILTVVLIILILLLIWS